MSDEFKPRSKDDWIKYLVVIYRKDGVDPIKYPSLMRDIRIQAEFHQELQSQLDQIRFEQHYEIVEKASVYVQNQLKNFYETHNKKLSIVIKNQNILQNQIRQRATPEQISEILKQNSIQSKADRAKEIEEMEERIFRQLRAKPPALQSESPDLFSKEAWAGFFAQPLGVALAAIAILLILNLFF